MWQKKKKIRSHCRMVTYPFFFASTRGTTMHEILHTFTHTHDIDAYHVHAHSLFRSFASLIHSHTYVYTNEFGDFPHHIISIYPFKMDNFCHFGSLYCSTITYTHFKHKLTHELKKMQEYSILIGTHLGLSY